MRLIWDVHAALAKLYRRDGKDALAAEHRAAVQDIVSRIAENLKDPELRAGLPLDRG